MTVAAAYATSSICTRISPSSLRNGCQPQGNVVLLWSGKAEFYM